MMRSRSKGKTVVQRAIQNTKFIKEIQKKQIRGQMLNKENTHQTKTR